MGLLLSGQSMAIWTDLHSRCLPDSCPPTEKQQNDERSVYVGIGSSASADDFKATSTTQMPEAKRWDHRLAPESLHRQPSHLKNVMKFYGPGVVNMCGGLPSSDFFPFENMTVEFSSVPHSGYASWAPTGNAISSSKSDATKGMSDYDLSIALNYGQSKGPPQLLRWVTEHMEMIHAPIYQDWDVCLTVGNTMATDICLRMFGQQNTGILMEEYTYSSAIQAALPLGIKPIGVKMDDEGIIPDDLDGLLERWNERERGMPKPFLLYTIPTGQNPTGVTTPLARKQLVYAVAEKHDLIIIEDDPYFFLQLGDYRTATSETHAIKKGSCNSSSALNPLIPSYLSIDTSGRVVRLDSFSKVICPGSRAGWITASAQLIERCVRHIELSSQQPSGFTLLSLYNLLERHWGHDGLWHWLSYVRTAYTAKRNLIIKACKVNFPAEIISLTPPNAGMFIWLKVDVSRHPFIAGKSNITNSMLWQAEESIFSAIAQRKVLVARGSWFYTDGYSVASSVAEASVKPQVLFRVCFASVNNEEIFGAMQRLSDAIRAEFGL